MGDLIVMIWDPGLQTALFTEHEISYIMRSGTSQMAADDFKQNIAFIMVKFWRNSTQKKCSKKLSNGDFKRDLWDPAISDKMNPCTQ